MNEIAGYLFNDDSLLKVALTHSSYSKDNYERFEYLGDSILDFLVAEYFFDKTQENEGILTKLRAYFVSENYLADIFDKLDLQKNILTGKSCKGQISKAVKADMVESLIASIYLDCRDIDFLRRYVVDLLNLGNWKNIDFADFKTQLQEYVQAKNKKVVYKVISKTGLSHEPLWLMGVYLDNSLIGKGEAGNKNHAEQIAAKQGLMFLKGEKI